MKVADDLYLMGASPEQALLAVQQVAEIMANGGGWEPVGYAPLDELCDYLVCMAHAVVDYGVRVDRDVLIDLHAYVQQNRTTAAAGTGGPNVSGVERIAAERQRQIDAEGYTPEHDAGHAPGELNAAARVYLTEVVRQLGGHGWSSRPSLDDHDAHTYGWPWVSFTNGDEGRVRADGWSPSHDPVRNLEKAGALIAAEIDRLLAAGTGGAR